MFLFFLIEWALNIIQLFNKCAHLALFFANQRISLTSCVSPRKITLLDVPAGSPTRGGDVMVYV